MDKYNASVSLRNAAYSPRKLMLIYSGVTLGLTLLLSIVSYFLNFAIQPSGGLGSMNLQAILSTSQAGLQLLQLLVTPFWAAGLCFVAINIARGQCVSPRDLISGFHKIGPIISSTLAMGFQYLWRVFLGTMISSQILAFTPVATILSEASAKVEDTTAQVDWKALLGKNYYPVMAAYIGITAAVMLILLLPVFRL